MAENIVKIHFKPDGDEALVKAIQVLDKETKKLLNTQAKIIDSNKKHTVSQKKGQTQAEKNAVALDKLRVKLTALGFDYNKVVVANKHFGSALAGSRVSLEKVTLATKKYIAEQTKADISTRILGGSFAVLRSQLLLFNFAMALGVRQIGRLVGESAKVQGMETAFNTLSGATENSSIALGKLKKATDNTMSSFDLFQQANNAMILGVSKNSDEMAEMFDIAQRLGRALGRDTASSVESLITGIGRQSRLMLDNIGIIVKSEEAYEAFAKANDTTVEALTDAQKKQAFLNATMDSARAKVKTLGDETLTSQDVYDKLTTATTNLATQTGEFLQPLLIGTSKMFTDLATSASSYLNSINIADRAVEKNMSTEEKRAILKARLEKIQTALNRAELFGSSDEFGYKSGQDEKQILMKRRIEKIKKILLKLDKEEEELKKVKNITEDDGNKIIDYRAQISQKELKIIKQKNEAMLGEFAIVEQLALIEEQRDLIKLQLLQKDITKQDADKKDLELTGKKIKLEEQLDTVRMESASNTLGALAQLAQAGRSTFELGKALALAQAIIDAYGAGNKVLNSKLPFPTNVIAMAGVIATGLNNVAKIRSQKFEAGGLVGGRLHSQGGTMIEAEKGEFVMSRNAVQSIGTETLSQMNQTGNAGVTVNISAPLVDETVIDTIIPAIEKAQRMNLA